MVIQFDLPFVSAPPTTHGTSIAATSRVEQVICQPSSCHHRPLLREPPGEVTTLSRSTTVVTPGSTLMVLYPWL